MDEYLIKEFEAYLQTNEKIIWVGESKKNDASTLGKDIADKKEVFNILVFLVEYLYIIITALGFVICSMLVNDKELSNALLMFAPIVVITLLVLHFVKKRTGKNSIGLNNLINPASYGKVNYAISNKRILISISARKKELIKINLNEIKNVEVIEHEDNLYSFILLGHTINGQSSNARKKVLGLIQGVENGKELHRLLLKNRASII